MEVWLHRREMFLEGGLEGAEEAWEILVLEGDLGDLGKMGLVLEGEVVLEVETSDKEWSLQANGGGVREYLKDLRVEVEEGEVTVVGVMGEDLEEDGVDGNK